MRESGALTVLAVDEAQTRHVGALLARALSPAHETGLVIALQGELGAGKTTLVRGLLRALGIVDSIRSPTYTLIETYAAGEWTIQHLDWYRLADTEDLEALGFRDLPGPAQLILLEWPERAPAVAASADLHLELKYLPVGRELVWRAQTGNGERVLKVFRALLDAETSI